MDYNARMYSAYLNRFASPDSIVPDFSNPQSLNRYAYALNNPIKYNDPSGHCVSGLGVDTVACVIVGGIILGLGVLDAVDIGTSIYTLHTSDSEAERAEAQAAIADYAQFAQMGNIAPTPGEGIGIAMVYGGTRGANKLRPIIKKAALGLGKYLDDFATQVGGKHYHDWWEGDDALITMHDLLNSRDDSTTAVGSFFDFTFPTAINNADEVHFSTKGLGEIGEAIRKGELGDGWTNEELYMILHNKDWYEKTTFYGENGNIIDLEYLGE